MIPGETQRRVWHAVEVECDADQADAIGSFLLDRGAPGLQTEERAGRVFVTGHFADAGVERAVDAYLEQILDSAATARRPVVRATQIEDADWAENWKAHFPPLAIGARVFVHPPWVSEIPAGRVGIELDPGMAFGTGHHGSTQGCLAALDALVTAAQAPRLLDIGTGSGVLAIAAIKLGARSALAVDIDPLACEIAADNARRNGVAGCVEVANRLAADRADFDIVVANIFSGMLIGLARDIARRLRPGAHAVGAGLETADAAAVGEAWTAAGLTHVRDYEVDGWTTLVFRAPTTPPTH